MVGASSRLAFKIVVLYRRSSNHAMMIKNSALSIDLLENISLPLQVCLF